MHGNTAHGHATRSGGISPTYKSWQAILERCRNPNSPRYADYGGRGIDYDPRWNRFENFLADMGERPEGLSIERRNNNAGYSKDNCYWATDSEQNINKRTYSNNTSGCKGVSWIERQRKWVAYINVDGVRTSLGSFKHYEEAVAVRISAEERLHGRHG